ncbi:MAG: hypothetical protein ACFFBD_27195 [Candidatus Hodarchaeota archaeon]
MITSGKIANRWFSLKFDSNFPITVTSDLSYLEPILREVVKTSTPFIQQMDLQTFACTLKTKEELSPSMQQLPLTENNKNRLAQVLEKSTTSISWGSGDLEVIILIFDNSKEAHSLSKPELSGLFLHEMMHSIQRQRGLEDDLQRSLGFSLNFFTNLADYIPKGHFPKEEIISFLKAISKFAVFALKDLYANTELIRRGKTLEVLEFYEMLLGLKPNVKASIQAPDFDNLYEKGTIVLKSLSGLEFAINYMMSLIPAFLPFSKLNRVKNEVLKKRGDRIRKHILETYFSTLPTYMDEFLCLEDLYLTSFAFNEAFHRKFFGSFFNSVLELILGEDFAFYHMSKISEIIDLLYQGRPERQNEILFPLLKAAYYLFILRGEPGIQTENYDLLKDMVSKTIPKEELTEFLEYMATDPDAQVTDLLEMTFFQLVVDLREQLLIGYEEYLRIYCRALLILLRVMSHLNQAKLEYLVLKKLIYQLINHKRRLFYRVLFMGQLELFAGWCFFQTENLSSAEFEELMFNLQYFGVFVDNDVFNLVIAYGQVIKLCLEKTSPDDPNFPISTALSCSAIASQKIKEPDTREEALPILRATLLAIGCSFNTVRKVAKAFGAIFNGDESPNYNNKLL